MQAQYDSETFLEFMLKPDLGENLLLACIANKIYDVQLC